MTGVLSFRVGVSFSSSRFRGGEGGANAPPFGGK